MLQLDVKLLTIYIYICNRRRSVSFAYYKYTCMYVIKKKQIIFCATRSSFLFSTSNKAAVFSINNNNNNNIVESGAASRKVPKI